MSPHLLRLVMPNSGARAESYSLHLIRAAVEFGITNKLRRCAFIATIAVESGELQYVEEIASGDAYEGRIDLGNTQPGDGRKFKGHGLGQITGRKNHWECGRALGLDLITDPLLLTKPVNAARSAAWFWQSRGFNELADQRRFGRVCKTWNGGYNGLDERIEFYARAREVLI